METNEKKPEQKEWAESVKLLFPNTKTRGAHVNLSGMVLAKHAPNKANAVKLMEFLASKKAQGIYANVNNEYPIDPNVKASPLLESWGKFPRDTVALDTIAKNRAPALKIVNSVGYNHGPVTN